ncbi:MAG: DNA mismatch repair protein MutS, partial [Marinomonas sp.]
MAKPPTPMMQQFLELKEQASGSLLFYRMGDFFELFFEDARIAAGILNIALTSRGEHDGEPVPMCGVPVHAAEGYLARLIKGGCRVAIAEQIETPEEAKLRTKAEGKPASKALVQRDIVRFVTAGTLTEEALLEPRSANILAAAAEVRGTIGIASCDISTGAMLLEECPPDMLNAALARLGPSECVVPEGWEWASGEDIERPKSGFSSDGGLARLKTVHGVATLDGFGDFSRAMLAAAGGLIEYLDHVGRGTLPLLLPPKVHAGDAVMVIDEATRSNLEILSAQSGSRDGSLIASVDRCVTGAGARMLAGDLAAPLYNREAITQRLGLGSWLHGDPITRANLRDGLRSLPDLGRALGRIMAGRGSPRDLGQVRDGLRDASNLREMLGTLSDQPVLLAELLPDLAGHGDTGHGALVDLLSRALVTSPPTERSNGGFIAEGYDHGLDELRATSGNARRAIAAMEARYREDTDIASLKIKHNGVLGYFIEVPSRHGDALMEADSGFTHRQTMKGAVRFNSVDLHEEASRIAEAGGHALAAEEAHFEDLVANIAARAQAIARTAEALARIDVSAGQAERAAEGGW